MIVKLQTAGGNWVLFDEIDYLSYSDVTDDDIPVMEGVIDYTHQFPPEVPSPQSENPKHDPENTAKEIRIMLFFMNKNQITDTQVLCHPPVFIMNNDGKTIDKL